MKTMVNKLLVFVLFMGTFSAYSQTKDIIEGRWLTAAGDSHVLIYEKGGKFFGRLIWLKNPADSNGMPRLDKNNPNAGLSKRPLIGSEILRDFSFIDGVWEGGSIYDPKTGKTYSCIISLASRNKINVRGYVGFSVLGRTENWLRVP